MVSNATSVSFKDAEGARLKWMMTFTTNKRKKTESLEEDPFLSIARDEYELKMKVLKLKEWKLMHQCDNMGIGLPPAYDTDEQSKATCSLKFFEL